jgi:hypothetical protein
MEETQIAEIISQDSLSLITKAEIDVQISTAKAFPRSIKNFMDKALSIATINESVAASCGYAVPRSGTTITGKSVRLAEIVCASYGNIRSGSRIISNDGQFVTAQGICHDLETNNCRTVEVRRKITDKNGKTFSADMQIMTANAAGSIAYRNAVFSVVPSALVDDIYEKTKEVAKGTLETLPKRRVKAVDYFKSLGVKEQQICDALEVKRIEDIDLEKLFTLTGMRSAILNNEATIKTLFEKEPIDNKPSSKIFSEELKRVSFILDDLNTAKEVIDFIAKVDISSWSDADLLELAIIKESRLSTLAKK